MDTTMVTFKKAKRVQSTRKRKASHNGFLPNLVMNSLTIVGCIFLLYSPTKQFLFLHLPNMLSNLSSPIYVFLLVNAIVVFLVGESRINRYKGSWRSSPTSDIYEEYSRRARGQRKLATLTTSSSTPVQENCVQLTCEMKRDIAMADKVASYDDGTVTCQVERGVIVVDDDKISSFEEGVIESQTESEIVTVDEITSFESETNEHEEQQVIHGNGNDGGKGEEEQVGVEEKIEEKGGGRDELNRRIEDFIAKVNRQRQLEIQSLVACKG